MVADVVSPIVSVVVINGAVVVQLLLLLLLSMMLLLVVVVFVIFLLSFFGTAVSLYVIISWLYLYPDPALSHNIKLNYNTRYGAVKRS